MSQLEPSPRPRSIRVLHVDDEATQLEFTKRFLEMADESLHIESVDSSEEALRLLESETYDCIVSDFQMSPMDGIELARRVRKTSDVPFIIYTGRGSEEVAEAAFAVGVDDYIRKEIDPSHYRVLTRRIRMAVEKHRAERALQRQLNEMQIILDSVPAIIFYKDKENRLVKVNQALIDSSGLSREELEGRDLVEIYPDLANDYWRDDLEVINTGRAKRGIVEPLETPGGVRWLATDKIPYRDEREEITGVIGFSIDITERKRMEEELRTSEELYRTLLEEGMDAVAIAVDSEYVYVNKTFVELLGYSVSEMMGKRSSELVDPRDAGLLGEIIERRKDGEKQRLVYELRVLKKDGSSIWIEASSIVGEFEGKPATISNSRDITERKRMKEELAEREKRFRKVSELISDWAYSMRIKPDGTTVPEWVTEGFTKHCGFTLEEVADRSIWERQFFPEDDHIFEERLRSLLSNEKTISEYRLITKEGEIKWVRDYGYPEWDEDEKRVIRVYGAAQDITEQKRMEDEARKYQKQLEALHSSSFRLSKHDHLYGMFMETLDIIKNVLGFQYLGIAQIKGDEITYEAAVKVYQPEDYTIPLNQPSVVGRVFKTGNSELISDTRLDPDYYFDPIIQEAEQRLSLLAVPVLVEGEVAAVIDVEGVETGAFSEEDRKILETLADHVASAMTRIQSRRKLQELHEKHNKELLDGVQRVSSMVRHDLRGPLQTIMNAAYVAESNPERTAEMMEIIMNSVKHQSDVMEDWKNQDLEETMNLTETDLSQLIADTLAASLIPTRITVDVNADPMNVNLDKVKMRRVMDNLIRNATEAMEDGGTLTISTRENEHRIIIEVSDTGTGIPETERENIFKPFYTTKPGGVGLGLTYSRRTVEAHGGTINVESKAGEGAKLTISLPKKPEKD